MTEAKNQLGNNPDSFPGIPQIAFEDFTIIEMAQGPVIQIKLPNDLFEYLLSQRGKFRTEDIENARRTAQSSEGRKEWIQNLGLTLLSGNLPSDPTAISAPETLEFIDQKMEQLEAAAGKATLDLQVGLFEYDLEISERRWQIMVRTQFGIVFLESVARKMELGESTPTAATQDILRLIVSGRIRIINPEGEKVLEIVPIKKQELSQVGLFVQENLEFARGLNLSLDNLEFREQEGEEILAIVVSKGIIKRIEKRAREKAQSTLGLPDSAEELESFKEIEDLFRDTIATFIVRQICQDNLPGLLEKYSKNDITKIMKLLQESKVIVVEKSSAS